MTMTDRSRWIALYVLCLGTLMIVLDVTIVGVALPSIKADLGFSSNSIAWVVNAYLLTFGGCLLLGGRLGDLYGHRRLFLIGLAVFTVASLACGLSNSQGLLIAARAVQGLGGAVVSAVSFGLVMTLFTEPRERAKAMGIAGFVASGGGSIGVLLGGVLTGTLSWHWIFLVNVPIGILVFILTLRLLPEAPGHAINRMPGCLRQQPKRKNEDEDTDRHVDEEDPVPTERARKHAAEQHADRASARGNEARDAHRLRALSRLGEERHHEPERNGGHDGA